VTVTIDTNVLVHATDTDDPLSGAAFELLERLARGPELLYVFWPVVMGFLRIATHPSIKSRPLTPDEALANVTRLVERPNVRAPGEEPGFLGLYQATAPPHTRGKLVPDAHIATLMRQHGVRVIYTRDRDFRRFDGIDARDPFAAT
jgi:toxin-antitoxin system PIN domain toxin